MQFHALSLNDHFVLLTKQESELRMRLETFKSELKKIEESAQNSISIKDAIDKYLPSKNGSETMTFKQIKSVLDVGEPDRNAEKRIRREEAFCSSILLNGIEALQKGQSCLKYIGKYIAEHPVIISKVFSAREQVSEKLFLSQDPSKRKTTVIKKSGFTTPTHISSMHQLSDDPHEVPKPESLVSAPFLKLRDQLSVAFPSFSSAVSDALSAVIEALPVRLAAGGLNGKELVEKMRGVDQEDGKEWARRLVGLMFEEAHICMRSRLYQVFLTWKTLLQAVSDGSRFVEDNLPLAALNPQQKSVFEEEKSRLLTLSLGLPLKDVPDKLWELLKTVFEWKMRNLAIQQKGLFVLEDDFNSFASRIQGEVLKVDDEKEPGRGLNSSGFPTFKKDSEIEAEEQDLITTQRKEMRLGSNTPHHLMTRSSSDFSTPKISKIASIHKSEDLEKVLLGQVQGIEQKIKHIKSTERHMANSSHTKFPALKSFQSPGRKKKPTNLHLRLSRSPEKLR